MGVRAKCYQRKGFLERLGGGMGVRGQQASPREEDPEDVARKSVIGA